MVRDIGLLKFRHSKSRSCEILTFEKKDIQFEARRRRRPLWFSNWACVVKNHSSFKRASERASSSSYYFLILARARVRLSASLFLLCALSLVMFVLFAFLAPKQLFFSALSLVIVVLFAFLASKHSCLACSKAHKFLLVRACGGVLKRCLTCASLRSFKALLLLARALSSN